MGTGSRDVSVGSLFILDAGLHASQKGCIEITWPRSSAQNGAN